MKSNASSEADFETDRPELIHSFKDPDTGLQGVIVLHSTVLGPAMGGCRYWSYPSMAEAEEDCRRLAEGMAYKNVLADLPSGGGKAVIRRPERSIDRFELFKAFGRQVESLGGRYITAEDVGTGIPDMLAVSRTTRFVAGLPPHPGQAGGDPSPWTALGTLTAMHVAIERASRIRLKDCTVAIQGVGHVGASLAHLLRALGATVIVADVNPANVEQVVAACGARPVPVDQIQAVEADVFAPCALGGILNDRTIGTLKAKVICGAANNQLETAEDGVRLADRGILYAPDYVVNAGGIINVAAEYFGWGPDDAERRVRETGKRLGDVLDYASSTGLATNLAADAMARARIRSQGQLSTTRATD
ncbi:MAG: amino acid dehydrogenase [Bradyrhizobium sp.]|nr:amino acid dehydrogenase [Bradyrhizobium sp.]